MILLYGLAFPELRITNYSQNQKIKMVLSGKTGFVESIRKLLKLFAVQHDEQQQRNALARCKSTYIYNSTLPLPTLPVVWLHGSKLVSRRWQMLTV